MRVFQVQQWETSVKASSVCKRMLVVQAEGFQHQVMGPGKEFRLAGTPNQKAALKTATQCGFFSFNAKQWYIVPINTISPEEIIFLLPKVDNYWITLIFSMSPVLHIQWAIKQITLCHHQYLNSRYIQVTKEQSNPIGHNYSTAAC